MLEDSGVFFRIAISFHIISSNNFCDTVLLVLQEIINFLWSCYSTIVKQ